MTENSLLRYFAYGSNMYLARLRERTPSVIRVGRAELRGHLLRFHKLGADGSGKCDIFPSGAEEDVVHGVLFHLHRHEKPALDQVEGLGRGYEIKRVQVITDSGPVRAFSYYATRTAEGLQPYHWYKRLVLAGAEENALPAGYIGDVRAVVSIDDPDPERIRVAARLLSGSL